MNTRSGKLSDTSVPSGDAQNTEMNPGTVGRKRKKSTAGSSSKKKTTPVDHAVHMDGKQDRVLSKSF